MLVPKQCNLTVQFRLSPRDKIVIYLNIGGYGYFNAAQYPIHPSASLSGRTWVLQGVKISVNVDN